MENFEEIKPAAITENFIKLIGSDWMLVTVGQREHFNTMTASWGGVGFLWNKPVVFVFIRPQRYTFGFIEQEPMFTLSFLQRHTGLHCNCAGQSPEGIRIKWRKPV